MFSDHPEQVNVLSKSGSREYIKVPHHNLISRVISERLLVNAVVLGDMRLLHAAHRNMKPTRRNLLLIWHRYS